MERAQQRAARPTLPDRTFTGGAREPAPGRNGVRRRLSFDQPGAELGAGQHGLPPSLIVRALAFHGGAALAGTFGPGVFRSTNAGTNWLAANGGLTSPFVLSLAVSGADLFAGTKGGGVFRSSDQGASWTTINEGLNDTEVAALVVAGDRIFAGTQDYVYYSTNRGASWTQVRDGMGPNSRIRALTTHRGMIFAGADNGGVFRLAGDGASWIPLNLGQPNNQIYDTYALAANDQFIFAGTVDFSGTNPGRNEGGVFRSNDGGQTWMKVTDGLPNSALNIEELKVVGGTLLASTYGGVFRSSNNGIELEPGQPRTAHSRL